MKREIKFRAWNSEERRMWFEVQCAYDYIAGDDSNNGDNVPSTDFTNIINDKEWNLMQFTGLKDKNKVEIYEGDIVKNGNGIYLKIYFCEERAMFRQQVCCKKNVEEQGYEWQEAIEDRTDEGLEFNFKEVIGNIYENPELINN